MATQPLGGQLHIVRSGVIETTKGSIGTASADNLRRAREVFVELENVCREFPPYRMVGEAMSFPRNVVSAAMLSMSLGVVASISALHRAPIEVAGPMNLKGRLTGNRTADKAAMITAVKELYPETEWLARADLHEHQADAVAAVHYFCGVAQPAEHRTVNPVVAGSSPAPTAIKRRTL